MQRVLVLDKSKKPLMPCHSARARQLLRQKKAAVFRQYPFTIILKERDGGDVQPVTVKVDPGSKTTGIALVADFKAGKRVIWAGELTHRGQQIRDKLLSRSQIRRGRRHRKTRYRAPRFLNRRRAEGWTLAQEDTHAAEFFEDDLESVTGLIVSWLTDAFAD